MKKPELPFQSECPVCHLILREPYQVSCCGYAFCRVCIDSIDSANGPCPSCRNTTFNKFEDKGKKRSLYAFKVHCSNKEQGCQWVGELGQLDNHLNLNPSQQNQLQGCQLSQIQCLHCSEPFLRSDIEDHQSKKCPRRPFSCEYCKTFKSTYEKVTTNHWRVCRSCPMPCTNKCGETLQRQNLENHIANDCPLTIINCDFQHVGCEVRLPRIDMPIHLGESVVCHLSLQSMKNKQDISRLEEQLAQAMGKISKLKDEKKKLKQQVSSLTLQYESIKLHLIPICPAKVVVTYFEQRLKYTYMHEDGISRPFYTFCNGYHMCLKVKANSSSPSCDTPFVSVAIHIKKGEYDDELKWPFIGQIQVQLLPNQDQQESVENKTWIADFSSGDAATKITYWNRSSTGRCHKHFLSYSDLQLYLQDGCLIFSIELIDMIKTEPTKK